MKKLRSKSLRANIPVVILFLVIGIVMAVVMFPSLKTTMEEPINLDDVNFESDIDGLYVTGTIYGIYDWYCEETENGRVIGREYLIDANDYYYMGLCVDKSDFDKADSLMNASWDYLDGYIGYEELEKHQYEITGTIKKIPNDSMKFYKEYIDWYEYTPEEREMFLPYYIEAGKVNGVTPGGVIALALLSILFILLAILFLVLPLTGSYQKSIKKYIAASSCPDMTAEKIERFLQNTPEINNLRYNSEFICGQEGATTAFGEVSKLAWVYLHTVTHKRYFITVGKTHTLMLCFTDGTRHTVTMKNEAAAKNHMERLSEQFPYIIYGYSAELDRMFSKDLTGFLNLRYYQNQTSSY